MTTLYAFVNIKHPMVAWEVSIGRLASVKFSGLSRGAISLFMYNRMRMLSEDKNNNFVHDEFLLENIRSKKFSDKISRLSGLYFFDSKEDAMRANEEWKFNFPEYYLCEFSIDKENITKVDSEWITNRLGKGNVDGWMEKYWSGECYGDNPLMELIVSDGIGFVNNDRLRLEAYRSILDNYPGSTKLLSASCCLFSKGVQTISQVVPCLLWDGNVLSGDYIINIGDLETIPLKKIQTFFQDCEKDGDILPWVPHPDPNISFELPDFGPYKFELKPTDEQRSTLSTHFNQ